jgi:Cdc6-like AAA superfamily ATPase
MPTRSRTSTLPPEVIRLTKYAQLELYISKFARGELGLVLLLGRHGTGKSEIVRRTLRVSERSSDPGERVLYVEGHTQPFGLYRQLWEHRDRAVVLDDLDRLYADSDCVRLLKALCNTVREKRLNWLTNHTMNDRSVPSSFATTSSVILIANEWKSLNPNVRALEDRAIILHFTPPTWKCTARSASGWTTQLSTSLSSASCR